MFATFYSFLALPLLTSLCPPGGSHGGYLFRIPDKKPIHSWQEKLQLLTDRACVHVGRHDVAVIHVYEPSLESP